MRLLLTSDLHYKLPQYDWVMQAASRFDAVAIAGDLIDGGQPVPAHVQIKAIRASLAAIAEQRPLFVCSGNHDLNARDAAGEKYASWVQECRSAALSVDGDSTLVADTLITVCPWWDGPVGRKAVAELLDTAAAQRGNRWVWLYHAPPHGKLSWTGRRHFADALLPELIERHAPSAVLCGHIHEAPFQDAGGWNERIGDTWLFNAGRQTGETPARIEIDFAAGLATWVTSGGAQQCRLSGEAQ